MTVLCKNVGSTLRDMKTRNRVVGRVMAKICFVNFRMMKLGKHASYMRGKKYALETEPRCEAFMSRKFEPLNPYVLLRFIGTRTQNRLRRIEEQRFRILKVYPLTVLLTWAAYLRCPCSDCDRDLARDLRVAGWPRLPRRSRGPRQRCR